MNWRQLRGNMISWLRRFMVGRYGTDQLNLVILITSLILAILRFRFGYYVGIILVFYRSLSRDIVRRHKENSWFLARKAGLQRWFNIRRRIFEERNTHRHLKCPGCQQRLRVPKGRGKITVTCSRCGQKFGAKS